MTGDTAVLTSTVTGAAAVALMMRPAALDRANRLLGAPAGRKLKLSPTQLVQLCSLILGVAIIGGTAGLIGGIGAAVIAPTVMNRLERRADAQRRERLTGQLPLVCDLLSVAMAAGRPPQMALAEVASAVSDPAATQLATVADRMKLSADSADAWDGIDPELAEIGRALRRSERSGTPLAQVLSRAADEQRRSARAGIQHKIQRISVRTAAPLGLCFLPAFFLVGVCPVLIGSVSEFLP